MSRPTGPLDRAQWPSRLVARVVAPGERPSILGYDVEGDLARHYAFGETLLLVLTGELATEAQARAFDVAMQFAAPAPVNEAPTHAAVLARICAGTTSSIVGTAAIALAEQARATLATHEAWLAWLDAPAGEVDAAFRAPSDGERASVERLREALRGVLDVPALAHDVSRQAAVLATLHACGVRDAARLECALVVAKLAVAAAEALATAPASHRDYPLHQPPIAYEDGP